MSELRRTAFVVDRGVDKPSQPSNLFPNHEKPRVFRTPVALFRNPFKE